MKIFLAQVHHHRIDTARGQHLVFEIEIVSMFLSHQSE